MKYASRSAIFWALVAAQPFSTAVAFGPALRTGGTNRRRVPDNSQKSPYRAATLEDVDQSISMEPSVKKVIGDVSVSEFEDYRNILQDEENFPVGSLPKNVVKASLETITKSSNLETVEGARQVDQLIQRLEREDPRILSQQHYAVAVRAWAKSGHAKAAGRSEKALLRMQELAKTNPLLAPDQQAFSCVLNAYAQQGSAMKAYALLRQMQQNPDVTPTRDDYKTVLSSLAQQGDARKAEEVLKTMVDLCNEGAKHYQPNQYCYRMVLDSWARSSEPGKGQRAQEILAAMHGQEALSLEPDVRTYTSVMNAIVRSDDADRVEQAQRLLEEATARGVTADAYLMTSAMQAYANAGQVEKTEEILEQMEREGIAVPAAYNTVIKAWKSSGSNDAPERAARWLERMASLGLANGIGYTCVMAAYANRGDVESAEKVESLLQDMEHLYQEGNDNVVPNTQTFNTVLNCWVQSGDMVRAEIILNKMEQSARLRPNVVSYATVMNGWWKSNKTIGAIRAERLFRRMVEAYKAGNKSARPNLISYVSLINAIIRTGERNSAQRAEDAFFDMYEDYCNGNMDVKPNVRVVALVMDSWQKSGLREAGEKAEALLNWMWDKYNETDDKDFQPNEYICSLAISAWSKSRSFGKAARARRILQQMKALHESGTISTPPNTHCYTAVINSCAYCMDEPSEKRQALEIALATYKELERTPSHGTPNHVTYATTLVALNNLLPPSKSRSSAVQSIFRRCCDVGQVDGLVVRRLQQALTPAEFREVCPESLVAASHDGLISNHAIPKEWRKNLVL